MNTKLILIFLIVFSFSCRNNRKESVQNVPDTKEAINEPDTLTGSIPITDEIAGSAYRKRAKGYFIIAGGDTSAFMPIFTESKKSIVGIDIRFNKEMTYAQQFKELKTLLAEAVKDFEFDSIRSITLGRLISTGDLAIEISNELNLDKELKNNLNDYPKVVVFLMKSKLTSDFNSLLNPYNIYVDTIYPEKLFFASQKEIFTYSKIETDSVQIPDKILDCITGIGLKKE